MSNSGIYSITHIASGRQYIGSAVNIQKRWCVHKSQLKSGKHHSKKLQRSWDKYGESAFCIQVVELVAEKEMLLCREQFYLDRIGNNRNSFNNNPTAGSSLGRKLSERSKQKISMKATGRKASEETKMKMSVVMKGKKKSIEHVAKLAALNRLRASKPISEETRRKMSESAKRRMMSTPRGKYGRFYAFGADHDVIWSDPKHAKKMMQEAKEYLDKFNKQVSKESCGVYE